MKETFTKYQKDEFGIFGAEVIGIAKSNIDGRKVVLLKKKNGEDFHLEIGRAHV